ncbi:MAG: hypothetical protein WEA75_11325 [Acidimicrobiia bacterium]
MRIRRFSPPSTATPASDHPPHAGRPTAARAPNRRFVRSGRLVPVLVAVLVVAGCGPRPSAGPSKYVGPTALVANAVKAAFGPYGPAVVKQAFNVSQCESGWVPTAGAGSYHQGLFQLGRHIVAIQSYGGNFLDPYQNALAARDLYVSRGHSWSAWGCRA